jgi:hypothetical protein
LTRPSTPKNRTEERRSYLATLRAGALFFVAWLIEELLKSGEHARNCLGSAEIRDRVGNRILVTQTKQRR